MQMTSAAVHGYADLAPVSAVRFKAILILVNGNSNHNVNVGESNAHKNNHFYTS